MNNDGPVIIIEDDFDDQYFLDLVFKKLDYPNEVIYFHDPQQALSFLRETKQVPFLILSDINMPGLDGFALRNIVHTNPELRDRCIPYLFLSTAASQQMVMDVYNLSVQGYFVKKTSLDDVEKTISVIMEYWRLCVAPNNFLALQPLL